jgi:hypothetical protein
MENINFKTPSVLPVKADAPNPRIKPVHPNMIQPPSLFCVVGSIRGGKTTLLNSLIFQSREDGFYDAQNYFDRIIVMSNTLNNDPCARFIKKACDCCDHYNDGMITQFMESQKAIGERDDMPFVAMFLDDILQRNGVGGKRNNEVDFLATRMRHMNVGLLGIFIQQLKALSTIVRNNCTDVIIMKQPNMKQLIGCYEEWGGQFGSLDNFMKIYKYATSTPFSFLYLKVREGKALKSFDEVIAEGETLLFNPEPLLKEEKKENKIKNELLKSEKVESKNLDEKKDEK